MENLIHSQVLVAVCQTSMKNRNELDSLVDPFRSQGHHSIDIHELRLEIVSIRCPYAENR